jgi:chemotaxis protein methyltransferase CheR
MPPMTATWIEPSPELSDRDLANITRIVYEQSGIRLNPEKRALVTARLQKRLKEGGFRSYREYVSFVCSDASGAEMTALVDAIATNHTSLFRESQHFEFLRSVVVPPLAARPDRRQILGWSAACATGEEPYSIAMTMFELLGEDARQHVRLLASDLSTKALAAAETGIYKEERIEHLPVSLQRKYFERGVGSQLGFVRVAPSIRRAVEFHRANLLEAPPAGLPFDFVFCRNVMIYFDRAAQQRVVESIERRLARGGYLFISHSESLNGIRHGLTWVAPAVYRRVS